MSTSTIRGSGLWVGLATGLVIGLLVGAGAVYLLSSLNVGQAGASTATTPTLPAPVAVSLNPKTTAVLVLDYVFCSRVAGCNETLPAVQTLIGAARSAGAPIFYTRTGMPRAIANRTGDVVITNDTEPDKFYGTALGNLLQGRGITTVVIMGIAANGALLYTAQESCVRHLTVVVPVDTVVGNDFVRSYVPYQLLNGYGCSNPNNTPLSAGHATLSTTSTITFKVEP